jgi:hypothetical protein
MAKQKKSERLPPIEQDPEYDPQQDVIPQSAKDWEAGASITEIIMSKNEQSETVAQKIARLKAEVAALETKDQEEKKAKILSLPESLGYGSGVDGMVALVTALIPYTDNKLKLGGKGKAKAKSTEGRKRGVVTPEIKQAIIADLAPGLLTAGAIATKYSLSTATINTIKRDAGLTKKK